MRKQIKKYGNTLIVNFTSEDVKSYNLKVGDVVDVKQVEEKDGD